MMSTKSIGGSTKIRWAIATTVVAMDCASAGTGTSASAPGGSTTSTNSTGTPTNAGTTRAPGAWRVMTMEHVDLWLHGFALLTSDTGHVPFFARGYKQRITAAKRQRNVFTQLDANQQDLSARFASNPALTNGQFIAMYFGSLEQIVSATDFFIR